MTVYGWDDLVSECNPKNSKTSQNLGEGLCLITLFRQLCCFPGVYFLGLASCFWLSPGLCI